MRAAPKEKRARKNKGRFVTPNRSLKKQGGGSGSGGGLKKQETGQDLKMEESG